MTDSLLLDHAGKRILITGASQGIGNATARAFADGGARIAVVARREERLRALVDELGGVDAGHAWRAVDLTDADAAAAATRDLLDEGGTFDVVVHCVGGSLGLRDVMAPPADWERIWRLNVGAPIVVNNVAVPAMQAAGWGRIVMLSSRVAVTCEGAPAYNAAKAALNAYVTSLGRALAGDGIVACAVMLGAVAAEGNSWFKAQTDNPQAVRSYLENSMSLGRLGGPSDIVPLIRFLASEHNTFGAGAILPYDGGAR